MRDPQQAHSCLHEAYRFTHAAEAVLRDLLHSPTSTDPARINEALTALRLALLHLDPAVAPDTL